MKNSEPPKSDRHPHDLLLPYVEGLLNPEENASVQEHIAECAECSAQVKALQETVNHLRGHKDAFCPDLSELHEFAFYGSDAAGAISDHVEDCPACKHLVQAWKSEASKEHLPQELWDRLSKALSQDRKKEIRIRARPVGFMERFRAIFDAQTWAIGAVTVVALLAVMLLYPREIPQYTVALSSTTWEGVSRPKTFQSVPNRTAIVIVLKDFHPAVDQAKIDDLYDAVAPTMDIYERYYVAPPGAIRDAVRKGLIDPADPTKLLRGLKDHLDLTSMVLVTAVSETEGITFEADLVDLSTGKILDKKTESKLAENDLGPKIRQAVLNLLHEH